MWRLVLSSTAARATSQTTGSWRISSTCCYGSDSRIEWMGWASTLVRKVPVEFIIPFCTGIELVSDSSDQQTDNKVDPNRIQITSSSNNAASLTQVQYQYTRKPTDKAQVDTSDNETSAASTNRDDELSIDELMAQMKGMWMKRRRDWLIYYRISSSMMINLYQNIIRGFTLYCFLSIYLFFVAVVIVVTFHWVWKKRRAIENCIQKPVCVVLRRQAYPHRWRTWILQCLEEKLNS